MIRGERWLLPTLHCKNKFVVLTNFVVLMNCCFNKYFVTLTVNCDNKHLFISVTLAICHCNNQNVVYTFVCLDQLQLHCQKYSGILL